MLNSMKLKGRLRECNYSQADLAQFMGLSTATICQKINGTRPITITEAEMIAKFLGIPDSEYADYFFSH